MTGWEFRPPQGRDKRAAAVKEIVGECSDCGWFKEGNTLHAIHVNGAREKELLSFCPECWAVRDAMDEKVRIGDWVELCGPMNPQMNGLRGVVISKDEKWAASGVSLYTVKTELGGRLVTPGAMKVVARKISSRILETDPNICETRVMCHKCLDEFYHYHPTARKWAAPRCPTCDPDRDWDD
jgi:hypothetical protein